MPPSGGISSPPCISSLELMFDGAAASLPAWGFFNHQTKSTQHSSTESVLILHTDTLFDCEVYHNLHD